MTTCDLNSSIARVSATMWTERAIDAGGELLWEKPYPFKRLPALGEVFIQHRVKYGVIGVQIDVDKKLLVTTVRRIKT